MSQKHLFREGFSPTVVLIDDSELEREAIASYLTQLGYDVKQAGDGIAGVKLVTASPPSVVVLDVAMPRMNGVEVLRRLRAATATRPVYVIVTSALVGARDRQLAFEAGCNQYIVKPFELASLARAIHTYFIKLGAALPPTD